MSKEEFVEAAVDIEASFAPRLSLAFHQNAVPFLRELAIANGWEDDLQDVELTLTSEPGFLATRTWRIESIGPGQRYHLG
jgi:hypothetical protein